MVPFLSENGMHHVRNACLWSGFVLVISSSILYHGLEITISHSRLLLSSGVSKTLRDITLGPLSWWKRTSGARSPDPLEMVLHPGGSMSSDMFCDGHV